MNPKRVGIVGLLQESNTFIQGKTTLQHFKDDLYLVGEEVRRQMAEAPHEVGGFFEGLEAADMEAVPIFLARAIPFGVIEGQAFDALVTTMLSGLTAAGLLDGILAAPHGATVAENHPDADGYWLSRVREAVGKDTPIIATIDPHANLSQAMVDATNALIAYATNPHLDQRQTGRKSADLLARTLRGEVFPVQTASFPSMAINIQSQNTSEPPLSYLYEGAAKIADRKGILSHSVVLGFPYADVAEMGSSVIAVTDNNPDLANEVVVEIGACMWEQRRSFEPVFTNPEGAVKVTLEAKEFPTLLLDMGDNIGGGSSADGTCLLRELHENSADRSLVILYDPEAVVIACEAGVGSELELTVGGKSDSLHGEPFTAVFQVNSQHQGKFQETTARHGGFTDFDQGSTAIVCTVDTGIIVMLTSKRVPPFSLKQLTAFGLDPLEFSIIVAKGVVAPLAAYSPIARSIIYVDTPGVTRADMTQLKYKHRRQPLFPFET